MRDIKIDLLRFIGLAMIILAHVGSHGFVFQLRNFDVPLMVLVSGMSFGLSYRTNEPFIAYMWKRVKRLVFPVWIFLSVYFITLLLLTPNNPVLNLKVVMTSYFLLGGIGYVWIIKVFLLVAIISPYIFKYHASTASHKKYFSTLTVILLSYEIFRYISLPYIAEGLGRMLSMITHDIIPYGVIFALGLRIPTLKKSQVSYLSVITGSIFITIGLILYLSEGRGFVPTQEYKYPPSIYYLSYALFVSCLLWVNIDLFERYIEKLKVKKAILFCAKNSIWVYLWHIPLLKVVQMHFIVNFVVVLLLSAIITSLQVSLIQKLRNHISNDRVAKNIKILFTG